MLFKQDVLRRIATGEITLAFRRWRRPSVSAGGTLLTPIGQLEIRSVRQVAAESISAREAERAGFASLAELHAELKKTRPGTLYRIEFRRLGDDPRIALREQDDLAPDEVEQLRAKLNRLDQRSSSGPWTLAILKLIAKYPERRAAELAAECGREKEWLKLHVRKLKNLGLTESLHPGYRLSPRGEALLTLLAAEEPRAAAARTASRRRS